MKNMIHKSSVSTRRRLVKSCGSRKPLPLSSTIVKRVSAANEAEGSPLIRRASLPREGVCPYIVRAPSLDKLDDRQT
jgi:hypothetical protein